jgi:hypothetical protein
MRRMKLGTLLLRDAVITLSQLEEGLRAQVLFGGRLGTNLVELGFLDLATLGRCLGAVAGVPLASQERFEAVDASVIERFPAKLADQYTAFPLGPELRSPETLAVALADPTPANAAELGGRLGGRIAPYAAPELRILYYVERHYGVQRSARFLRKADPTAPKDERRRTAPERELPTTIRFEPRRGRPPTAAPAPTRGSRVSVADAAAMLDRATHRDEIGDALIRYAAGRFGATVVFLLRHGNAIGWRALGPGGAVAVDQLTLPLGAASALQMANDTGAPFLGAPPSAGRPVERQLWAALGVADEPNDVAVVPVVVRRRVVNLIYVHGVDPAAATPFDGLDQVAGLAAEAYVRLIQATKGGDHG